MEKRKTIVKIIPKICFFEKIHTCYKSLTRLIWKKKEIKSPIWEIKVVASLYVLQTLKE